MKNISQIIAAGVMLFFASCSSEEDPEIKAPTSLGLL